VTYADAREIRVEGRPYPLRKFVGLNERTCLNQKPIVQKGDRVKKGQVIADGASTRNGELALGRNVLVAFMPWEGYNFEDAVICSEALLERDAFTSIHIDEFEIEIRETKLGREEFTADIPNVSDKALRNLDEFGIVRVGTRVRQGDILVGKVAPKSKSELSPEEKLLHAIFGRAGEDVKNDSLEVPSGVEGIVIDAQKFSRKINLTEDERRENQTRIDEAEKEFHGQARELTSKLLDELNAVYKGGFKPEPGMQPFEVASRVKPDDLRQLREDIKTKVIHSQDSTRKERATRLLKDFLDRIDELESDKNKLVNRLSRGDELPTGVLEMVKVYIATKRQLSVGDKMAGRHGNKGVVSKILSREDMPFLEDGTPVDLILNPLGVPSRMNVGQILETHAGWAAQKLGLQVLTPVFDGCEEQEIEDLLGEAGLPRDG
jgi:DNA-directed RNA polymerase subunit beta